MCRSNLATALDLGPPTDPIELIDDSREMRDDSLSEMTPTIIIEANPDTRSTPKITFHIHIF
jgi:hypothetical protein